jgi:outer membrane PBP1 activator LpoA protein
MRIRISHFASVCLLALSVTAAAEDTPALNVNVALLLPLSGPLTAVGESVRDGFLSAQQRFGGKGTVRVYDSGSNGEATLSAYEHALDDGAALVVGPLRKESVASLLNQASIKVPVLALNYLDETIPTPSDFYQFGLSPEDEARSAAERAVADGDKRALAMVPNTDWGQRVLSAFDKRLHELGGGVIQTARYTPGKSDFTKPIQDLMKLDASEARHKALTGIIGHKSEFEARRRNDADFIFMAARPADARLLWPQFRYFRATDLPVYATSLIYDGHPDRDLVGVRFCDMPWMIQSSSYADERAKSADASTPRRQPRLFAMGRDAYVLAGLIESGQLREGSSYPAATGNLQLTGKSVIARGLTCARFTAEGIQPLAAGLTDND